MKKSHTEKPGKLLPYLFMLTFISGVTAGSVFSLFCADGNIPTVTSAPKLTVFAESFKSFFKPCFVTWLSGFTRFSVYFSAVVLAYRGCVFGYLIAWFIKNSGIVSAVAATLPQNIIFFPFLLFVCIAAASQKKKYYGYVILFVLIILICSGSALLDTYLTSFLLKLTF